PFLLTELARHAALGTRGPEGAAVTVEVLIRERVQRLPAQVRRVLEMVAVAGQPLLRASARRAAYAESMDTQEPQALAILRTEHLIRVRYAAAEEELEVYHDRIREIVTAQLSPAELREHHRCLALALLGSAEADAEQLAFHFTEAHQPREAARYAIEAAGQAQ